MMRVPFAKVYRPFDLKDVGTFRTEWRQTACTLSSADGREVGFRDRGLVVLNRTPSYSAELHHVNGPWIRRPPGPLTLCLIVTPPYPARVVPSLSARQSKYAQRYHIKKRFLFPSPRDPNPSSQRAKFPLNQTIHSQFTFFEKRQRCLLRLPPRQTATATTSPVQTYRTADSPSSKTRKSMTFATSIPTPWMASPHLLITSRR